MKSDLHNPKKWPFYSDVLCHVQGDQEKAIELLWSEMDQLDGLSPVFAATSQLADIAKIDHAVNSYLNIAPLERSFLAQDPISTSSPEQGYQLLYRVIDLEHTGMTEFQSVSIEDLKHCLSANMQEPPTVIAIVLKITQVNVQKSRPTHMNVARTCSTLTSIVADHNASHLVFFPASLGEFETELVADLFPTKLCGVGQDGKDLWVASEPQIQFMSRRLRDRSEGTEDQLC